MSAIDAISMLQRGVTEITVDNLNVGNYSFPSTAGTNGQSLALLNNDLVWVNGGGGGGNVSSVSGTANQITVSPNPGVGDVTVGLPSVVNFRNNIVTNTDTQGNTSLTTAIGYQALNSLTNAHNTSTLIAIGNNAMLNYTDTGSGNQIVIGDYAGDSLTGSSNYNLVIGNNSLSDQYNDAPTNCVIYGHNTGRNLSAGLENIAIGNNSLSQSAGSSNTNTHDNIIIGNNTLDDVTTTPYSRNIVLGNNVPASAISANSQTGNFVVDPAHITSFQIGNILSGTSSQLVIPNMKNPFNVNPMSNGLFLSSDTSGNLSWAGGDGTGTVTSVANTDGNISVGPNPTTTPVVNFTTGNNAIHFPANIITNQNTQGNTSMTTAIGYNALANISNAYTDSLLIGIGAGALNALTSYGSSLNQCIIGNDSGTHLNVGSNFNVVVGNQSLADPTSILSTNNIVVGSYSGQDISQGQLNIIVGNGSMKTATTSTTNVNDNIVIGHDSLQNVVGGGNHNIVIGNSVDLVVANTNGNFLVDPANITSMTIGNVLSGTSSQLVIPNMKNPFNTNPSASGQVLSSDTSGNLSWIDGQETTWAYICVAGATYTSNGTMTFNTTDSQISSNISLSSTTITLPPNSNFIVQGNIASQNISGALSASVDFVLSNITGYQTAASLYGATLTANFPISGVFNTGSSSPTVQLTLTFNSPTSPSIDVTGYSYLTFIKV